MAKKPGLPKPALRPVARKLGGRVVEEAMDSVFPHSKPGKRTWRSRLASAALLRVALKSVPGAILVGGGVLAKTLHDRHKRRRADAVIEGAAAESELLTPEPAQDSKA